MLKLCHHSEDRDFRKPYLHVALHPRGHAGSSAPRHVDDSVLAEVTDIVNPLFSAYTSAPECSFSSRHARLSAVNVRLSPFDSVQSQGDRSELGTSIINGCEAGLS